MTGHWRRLAVQFLILGSMIVVNTIDARLYAILISLSLVVLPIAVWTVTAILLWTSHQDPTIKSLSDAADDMLTAAINATIAGAVGVVIFARLLGFITVPIGNIVSVGVGYIVVAMSLPALRKLVIWRSTWMPAIRDRSA